MSVKELGYDAFETVLDTHQIIFIDFWANWCAPCKAFSVVYEKVASKHPDIAFFSVDIEKESELAKEFSIQSVPHLLVLKEGIAIYSESGALTETVLSELVQQATDADVSKIKAEIEEKEARQG